MRQVVSVTARGVECLVSICVSVMELGWSVRVVRGDGRSESECSVLSVCGPRRKGSRAVRDFARVSGVAAKPLH